MTKSVVDAKQYAAQGALFLKEKYNVAIKHGHSLELAAIYRGHPNWDTASAVLGREAATTRTDPAQPRARPEKTQVRTFFLTADNVGEFVTAIEETLLNPKYLRQQRLDGTRNRLVLHCVTPFTVEQIPGWSALQRALADAKYDIAMTAITATQRAEYPPELCWKQVVWNDAAKNAQRQKADLTEFVNTLWRGMTVAEEDIRHHPAVRDQGISDFLLNFGLLELEFDPHVVVTYRNDDDREQHVNRTFTFPQHRLIGLSYRAETWEPLISKRASP